VSDSDDFRMLDSLMREDELLFRLGVTHLISVGYENLTEEAVERTILVIEKEALEEDEDSIPVITPEYQIAILKMAAKIREVPVWELLKFISRKVKIS
jgi:alanine dehydrogenase